MWEFILNYVCALIIGTLFWKLSPNSNFFNTMIIIYIVWIANTLESIRNILSDNRKAGKKC